MAYMTVAEVDRIAIGDSVRCAVAGAGSVRRGRACEVIYDARERTAYSYGRHFPLFRYVRPARGIGRGLFVINGDTWRGGGRGWNRSRTDNHQAETRKAIADTGRPSIIIPFSALTGAGFDIESVRPLAVRPDKQWRETLEYRTRAELPRHAQTYDHPVERSATSLDRVPTRERYRFTRYDYRERAQVTDPPDADGLYRWKEYVKRPVAPDADGLYRVEVWRHRLGDSVFSAVIPETEISDALPFETETDTARLTVNLTARPDADGAYASCGAPAHVSGPSGACIHCGALLGAERIYRTRRRYLSSFDYLEPAPLYFLAELPRGAITTTVDGAVESLAPRAVHAARLQGIPVARQGDVFFIDTPLTDAELWRRGATFGRLTQWTRDAKPRAGEVTYRAAPPLDERRRLAARENRYARRYWHEQFRALAARAETETIGRPSTPRGARKRWRNIRDRHEHELAAARRTLRRAVYGAAAPPSWIPRHDVARVRRWHADNVAAARKRLDTIAARGPVDAHGNTSARHARDTYRQRYGNNAAGMLARARDAAREKYRPETVATHERWRRDRETVRAHLAVYGTAHTATRVARVGDAVYVQGTVRHVPALEPGRGGVADHRPLVLTADRWYLAVRNTVPRQNRRRRRLPAARPTRATTER